MSEENPVLAAQAHMDALVESTPVLRDRKAALLAEIEAIDGILQRAGELTRRKPGRPRITKKRKEGTPPQIQT